MSVNGREKDPTAGDDRSLVVLAVTGALASGWGLFLWRELLRARAGADAFCGFGGGDCAGLWDGAFAGALHAATGLPVAAWGVVWGAVATILPLLAWSEPAGRWSGRLRSAIRATALAGVAGVVVLLLASAAEGGFCQACALTYVLSAVYAAVAWRRLGAAVDLPGVGLAAAVTAAMYLLLLYPGLRTPKHRASGESLAEAVAAATAGDPTTAPAAGNPAASESAGERADELAFLSPRS